MTTLTCASGQAFDISTSSCKDATTVNCIETMDDHVHHRHKRSVEEVHLIDIRVTKMKLIDAYRAIKPTIEELAMNLFPSIYDKFQGEYLPAIQSVRKDVMPFFYAKVYPHVQKWLRYFWKTSGKIFEKAYRSYELSNSTHISVVSISDIANDVSNELQPVIRLGRFLSLKMIENEQRYRHKRSIGEEVHTIDIQETKEKLIDAYRSIKPKIEEIARYIVPSIYEKFHEQYLPVIRSLKQDVLPFFYSKVYPHIQKGFQYSLKVAGKLVEKTYRSYELSNSTHIAIVSVSDIADEVSNDLKPIIRLGKYLSEQMMENEHVRNKRDVSNVRQKRQVPNFLYDLISPVVNNAIQSITSSIFGDGNSLTSQIILPVIYDIMNDPVSRYDVFKISMSAKSTLYPLIWRMMRENPIRTADGYIIQIPRPIFEKAKQEFLSETWPLIMKVLNKHLKTTLYRLGDNVPMILGAADSLVKSGYSNGQVLKDQFTDFMNKHKGLFRKSTSTHVKFYPVDVILADLRPIGVSFLNLGVEYLRKNPNSWLNMFFGEGSFLQRQVKGSPVYAEPRPGSNMKYYPEAKPQNKGPTYTQRKPQAAKPVYTAPKPQKSQPIYAKSH